jgi:hypothetical protein
MYGSLPDELSHSVGFSGRTHEPGTCHAQRTHPYGTPDTSPPTPLRSTDVITTRSGLSIPKGPVVRSIPGKPSRVEKTPQKKKKERIKAPKRADKLTKPLSELVSEHPDVFIADIDAYVHRSAEVRVKEVEECKIPGKIKRPMNAFMLYRKAYQNLAKSLCTQNNHQIVSQVCGDGWPMESDRIRDQFNEWARIERANHQNAHPGYKFTPAKPRKRKDGLSDVGSDAEDGEWGRSRGASRSRAKGPSSRVAGDSIRSSPSIFHPAYQQLGMPSVYHYTNSGKALPAPYDPSNLAGDIYYQQNIEQRHDGAAPAEDVFMRKTPSPALAYSLRQVPGDNFDLLGQYPMPHQLIEQMIDPLLLPHDASPFDGAYSNVYGAAAFAGHQKWNPQLGITESRYEPSEPLLQYGDGSLQEDAHLQILRGDESSWQIEEFNAGQLGHWPNPTEQ